MRETLRRWPEPVAVAGLILGYLVGGVSGDAVAGALLGGTVGLSIALWSCQA